jgi:hypothetical protein
MSLLSDVASFWIEGAMRTLEAFGQGYGSPQTDPPATTPYEVVYERDVAATSLPTAWAPP